MYDSRVNKSGIFESNQLVGSFIGSSIGRKTDTVVTLQCRYELEAQKPERIQIRFHDFNVPTERENSSRCHEEDALHVLAEVRGKYETQELLCGAFLPKPLMSSAQRMQLQFVGKYPPKMTNKVQYYGFRAEYKFLTSKGESNNECRYTMWVNSFLPFQISVFYRAYNRETSARSSTTAATGLAVSFTPPTFRDTIWRT